MNTGKFFATFVAFLFVFSASAQGIYKMGLTAGGNYSSLRSDLFTTASGRLSGAVGCSFVVGLNDRLEYNQEIVFVQKGATAKAVEFMPEDETKVDVFDFHYNSFEVASMVGYKPVETMPFNLQFGAFMGTHFHKMNRSDSEKYIVDYENIINAVRAVDFIDAFSGIDYGPVLGVSAGENRFRVNARYYYGMRNLYNNLDFVASGASIRTQSLRLTLTYFFKV